MRAYNKITRYARRSLAQSQQNTAAQEIVYQVDELYWQVVSLTHKKRLAESYAALLDSLQYNIRAMIEEGVATQSDGLTVAVKSNEAQISLTQVDNGLSLAKMVLAQMCGMPIDETYTLADETMEPRPTPLPDTPCCPTWKASLPTAARYRASHWPEKFSRTNRK